MKYSEYKKEFDEINQYFNNIKIDIDSVISKVPQDKKEAIQITLNEENEKISQVKNILEKLNENMNMGGKENSQQVEKDFNNLIGSIAALNTSAKGIFAYKDGYNAAEELFDNQNIQALIELHDKVTMFYLKLKKVFVADKQQTLKEEYEKFSKDRKEYIELRNTFNKKLAESGVNVANINEDFEKILKDVKKREDTIVELENKINTNTRDIDASRTIIKEKEDYLKYLSKTDLPKQNRILQDQKEKKTKLSSCQEIQKNIDISNNDLELSNSQYELLGNLIKESEDKTTKIKNDITKINNNNLKDYIQLLDKKVLYENIISSFTIYITLEKIVKPDNETQAAKQLYLNNIKANIKKLYADNTNKFDKMGNNELLKFIDSNLKKEDAALKENMNNLLNLIKKDKLYSKVNNDLSEYQTEKGKYYNLIEQKNKCYITINKIKNDIKTQTDMLNRDLKNIKFDSNNTKNILMEKINLELENIDAAIDLQVKNIDKIKENIANTQKELSDEKNLGKKLGKNISSASDEKNKLKKENENAIDKFKLYIDTFTDFSTLHEKYIDAKRQGNYTITLYNGNKKYLSNPMEEDIKKTAESFIPRENFAAKNHKNSDEFNAMWDALKSVKDFDNNNKEKTFDQALVELKDAATKYKLAKENQLRLSIFATTLRKSRLDLADKIIAFADDSKKLITETMKKEEIKDLTDKYDQISKKKFDTVRLKKDYADKIMFKKDKPEEKYTKENNLKVSVESYKSENDGYTFDAEEKLKKHDLIEEEEDDLDKDDELEDDDYNEIDNTF